MPVGANVAATFPAGVKFESPSFRNSEMDPSLPIETKSLSKSRSKSMVCVATAWSEDSITETANLNSLVACLIGAAAELADDSCRSDSKDRRSSGCGEARRRSVLTISLLFSTLNQSSIRLSASAKSPDWIPVLILLTKSSGVRPIFFVSAATDGSIARVRSRARETYRLPSAFFVSIFSRAARRAKNRFSGCESDMAPTASLASLAIAVGKPSMGSSICSSTVIIDPPRIDACGCFPRSLLAVLASLSNTSRRIDFVIDAGRSEAS